MKPEDFISAVGVPYPEEVAHVSWTSIEILPFLIGRKWDEIALAYVHAVRPTYIRVVRSSQTLDAREGRVTVNVDKDDIITNIEQEVQVALPEGIAHGHHLECVLNGYDYDPDRDDEGFFYCPYLPEQLSNVLIENINKK